MENKTCIHCKTELLGSYCYVCDEKIVSPKDFSLSTMVEQSVDVFTHMDSKLYRSFKKLLVSPGFLSEAYVMGLRKPFMKPFQIFILVNILFFVLLSDTDIFRKPSSWWFTVSADMGYSIKSMAGQKALELDLTMDQLSNAYDQKSKSVAKALVIAFIPILTLNFTILFIRKKFPTGQHIIFATHFFSFVLLIMVAWIELVNLLFGHVNNLIYVIPIQLIILVYLFYAVKKFYKSVWIYSIIASLLSLLVFNICLEIYRTMISLYSLNSLN